jgi:hypothetical protein
MGGFVVKEEPCHFCLAANDEERILQILLSLVIFLGFDPA